MKFSVLALMTLMIFGTVAPAQAQRISSEVGEKRIRVIVQTRRGHNQGYRKDREYDPQYRRVRYSRHSREVRDDNPHYRSRRGREVRGDNPRYRSRSRSRVVRGDNSRYRSRSRSRVVRVGNRENCSRRTRYFPRGYEEVYYR